MKRFWQQAVAGRQDGAWHILLDGKPLRLPGGPVLRLNTPRLAEAIAAEWQEAGGQAGGAMSMQDVPLTRLAGTALHQVAPDKAAAVAALARYAATDCLCYRATQPDALAVRQHHAWQPWLDWAADSYGARLAIAHGVVPITQPPAALAALSNAVAALDSSQLAGLGVLVPAYGSLVLGLAVAAGAVDAEAALALSELDELFQESQWGEDREALRRRSLLGRDVANAARFLALVAA